MAGAIEDDGGEVADVLALRLRDPAQVLGRAGRDVDRAGGARADGDLVHVERRTGVEHRTAFADGDHRERVVEALRGQRRAVDRVDRLEEELAILRGLWDEPDGWSFEGEYYQVRGALFRPRGPRPNLIVGGVGRPRSVRLGAQFADEYNISSSNPAEVREINARLDAACEKLGRDPATLTRSVMAGALVGRDEAEFAERRARQVAIFGGDVDGAEEWLEKRKDRWILGAPDEARARIDEYAATGIDRLLLQDFLPQDLDHIAVMGELIS